MSKHSQALEFTNITVELQFAADLMGVETKRIRSTKELRDVLNEIDEEEDFSIFITGTTQDGHRAHFRFNNRPSPDRPWHWGYVSFALDKLDSQAERLLQKIREILR